MSKHLVARSPLPPEESTHCTRCRKRPGTQRWVGDGGALALVHGFYSLWCERCVTEEQLKHAREAAARIPKLEARLAKLDSGRCP